MARTRAKKNAGKEHIAQGKLKVAIEAWSAQREGYAAINKQYEILLSTSGPYRSVGDEAVEYFRFICERVVADLCSGETKRQRVSG